MENKRLNKRDFGTKGEDLAGEYLWKSGYKIVSRNFRVGRMGEIDIIAEKDEYICFIEVKTRKSDIYGRPCEAVTHRKQHVLRKLALIYLSRNPLVKKNPRFDVIEIIYKGSKDFEINLIENAF